MKKRRPCTLNTSRSAASSPTSFLQGPSVKTKSSHDINRRRLKRSSPKLKAKGAEYSGQSVLSRDAFGSLESLFDIRKPLNLPEAQSLAIECYQVGQIPPFESGKQNNTKNLVELLLSQQRSDFEPHILEQAHDDRKDKPKAIKEELGVESAELSDITSSSLVKEKSSIMADNEEEIKIETEDEPEPEPDAEIKAEPDAEIAAEPGAESAAEAQDVKQELTETKSEVTSEKTEETDLERRQPGQPPAHPMPPGIGQGVPMKPGGRQESVLSSSPLTDPELLEEMKNADERCTVIMKEIEELKREILDLTEKKELSEEDTELLRSKQDELLAKMADVEQITRKLQSMLGLTDLSSLTFSKMFEMLPYPHTRSGMITEDGFREKKPRPEDLFDLPQIEYPEDKCVVKLE